jgi:hypothetical protein
MATLNPPVKLVSAHGLSPTLLALAHTSVEALLLNVILLQVWIVYIHRSPRNRIVPCRDVRFSSLFPITQFGPIRNNL